MRTQGKRPMPTHGIDEVNLYGGFDAESEALVTTVEAASLEAAGERISSVASQIGEKSPAEIGCSSNWGDFPDSAAIHGRIFLEIVGALKLVMAHRPPIGHFSVPILRVPSWHITGHIYKLFSSNFSSSLSAR